MYVSVVITAISSARVMSAWGSDAAPGGAFSASHGTWMKPARSPGVFALTCATVKNTSLQTNEPADSDTEAGMPLAAISVAIALTGSEDAYARGAPGMLAVSTG